VGGRPFAHARANHRWLRRRPPAHSERFTAAQRSEVANRSLQAGCRYAVCGGQSCEPWHDAVDEEFVRQHSDVPDESADAAHVMTTWHADESPDHVAFFFLLNTNFTEHDFKRFLVLHVGDGHAKGEVDAAVRRHAVNDGAA
jgi:hypothetical protein